MEINNLIRSKRRTIALIVERDGSLTVRAPKRTTLWEIEAFMREKEAWILRTQEKFKSVVAIPKKQFIDGEKFLFLGNEYELKLVPHQRPALKFNDEFLLTVASQKYAERLFTRWYKEQALRVISERVDLFAKEHGFTPKRVRITSARTRWGSCSPDSTLNFTWRLVMAPWAVIDYVVVHELAHLQVKNHSKRFWKAVEQMMPEYRTHRNWLRKSGEQLML